jgi:hypothetical protein
MTPPPMKLPMGRQRPGYFRQKFRNGSTFKVIVIFVEKSIKSKVKCIVTNPMTTHPNAMGPHAIDG